MASSVSFRRSIRWLPDDANEPTQTVVLTGGRTGVYLDVRFMKDSLKHELDWAFAGYRISNGPNKVIFKHDIDSRTLNASEVLDQGTNTLLPDGATLEIGEMINPKTGEMTPYEEIWEEEDLEEDTRALFIKSAIGSAWYARVGGWQLAMGRTPKDNAFWAWQARRNKVEGGSNEAEDEWTLLHATLGVDRTTVKFLPKNVPEWKEGSAVEWNGELWNIIEKDG